VCLLWNNNARIRASRPPPGSWDNKYPENSPIKTNCEYAHGRPTRISGEQNRLSQSSKFHLRLNIRLMPELDVLVGPCIGAAPIAGPFHAENIRYPSRKVSGSAGVEYCAIWGRQTSAETIGGYTRRLCEPKRPKRFNIINGDATEIMYIEVMLC
jgi:hypothetical protein